MLTPEEEVDSVIGSALLEGADPEEMMVLKPLLLDVITGRISGDDAIATILRRYND